VRPLVFTTLFPNSEQPHHGIFVKERMLRFSRRHAAPLSVVAPCPLAPPVGPRRWRTWAAIPREEQQDGLMVEHPRYLSPPGFGDSWRAGLMARGVRRCLLGAAARFLPSVLDAHYAWPDGVAAHRLRPVLEARLGRRLPLVITARGTDLNLAPGLPGVREQLAGALQAADHVICVAEALRSVALELGVAPERVTTLRNGVDVERFAPGDRRAAREALGLPPSGRILLCVGHLIERKGQHLLLQALARGGRAEPESLVLVGSGEDERRLRELAGRLGLHERVSFVGNVAPAELPPWYRAADALVLPSLREGWPNVVLEALACGTPVLATRIWGTPEILQGCAAGLLVEPTVDELADGLERLDSLDAGAARPWAEQRTWDETLDGLAAIFEQVGAS
jgi:glycosyltransferase involved in cell wall biosynthesis